MAEENNLRTYRIDILFKANTGPYEKTVFSTEIYSDQYDDWFDELCVRMNQQEGKRWVWSPGDIFIDLQEVLLVSITEVKKNTTKKDEGMKVICITCDRNIPPKKRWVETREGLMCESPCYHEYYDNGLFFQKKKILEF